MLQTTETNCKIQTLEAHRHFACFADTCSSPEGLDAPPTIASTSHQPIASIRAHAHHLTK
jgi:hypothetical protein